MEGCLEPATQPMRRYLIWDPVLRYSTNISPRWCAYWSYVVFSLTMQFWYAVGQFAFILRAPTLDKFAEACGTFGVVVYINSTNFLIIWQQKYWAKLIQNIEDVASEVYYLGGPAQREILKATCKRYLKIGQTFETMTLITGFSYLLCPLTYLYITKPEEPMPLLTLIYIPFERDNFFKRFVVFIFVIFGIIHNIYAYAYFTKFISCLLLFVNLGFLGLCENLKAAAISSDEQESNNIVVRFIKIHQKLTGLCSELEAVMNDVMLIRVLTCLISSSFLGLLVFIDFKANLRFIIVPVHEMFQLYIFCWSGNLIMDQGGRVPGAVYSMPWIGAQTSTIRLMLILMTRCRRPIKLTAGKFCGLTLKTFVGVLKTSLSYLTVLRNVQESD